MTFEELHDALIEHERSLKEKEALSKDSPFMLPITLKNQGSPPISNPRDHTTKVSI